MSDIKTRALDYLKSKPTLKVVFSTEDGFLFEKKQDAINHARNIGDKENPKVVVHTREIPPINKTKVEKTEKAEVKEKKPSPAELKAIKDKKVAEYVEVFGEEPNPKLSASELGKLIEEKQKEIVDNSAEQGAETTDKVEQIEETNDTEKNEE